MREEAQRSGRGRPVSERMRTLGVGSLHGRPRALRMSIHRPPGSPGASPSSSTGGTGTPPAAAARRSVLASAWTEWSPFAFSTTSSPFASRAPTTSDWVRHVRCGHTSTGSPQCWEMTRPARRQRFVRVSACSWFAVRSLITRGRPLQDRRSTGRRSAGRRAPRQTVPAVSQPLHSHFSFAPPAVPSKCHRRWP
jgi:hypothetical protein